MTIVDALPALTAAGTGAAVALKSPEILKEIYGDLAKPGVTQVGKALEAILGLGNTVLIPFRLLNGTARAFEQRYFDQMAVRFSQIDEQKVVSPAPEVALPIMDGLSKARDEKLRAMFIELLAKASTNDQVDMVHPSFAQVIASLAPQEAILLEAFNKLPNPPVVSMELGHIEQGKGKAVIEDLIIIPPAGVTQQKNIPLFLANLSGLGVVEILRDSHLTAPNIYDAAIEYAKSVYETQEVLNLVEPGRKIEYSTFVCRLSPYGRRLIDACT